MENINLEIIHVDKDIKNLVPMGIKNFQDWAESLSDSRLHTLLDVCGKTVMTNDEDDFFSTMSRCIFCVENNISDLPVDSHFLYELKENLIASLFNYYAVNTGLFKFDGPILLSREMIAGCGLRNIALNG